MNKENYLTITNSNELVRVATERIVYISSDGNYSTLVQSDKIERVFSVNLGDMLKLIESQLKAEAQTFIRIGKSLIINRNYIYSINPTKQQLILSDNCFQHYFELSASKEALKQLKTYIESTLKEGER
jgi:DNA-binding LytR/AlgR family response regulator